MTQQQPHPPTRTCAVCALAIPAAAKKCTHCDSSQSSAFRFIATASVVVGAVVAIAPLIDAARSLREIAEGRYKAEVRLRATQCRPSGISLIALNVGRGNAIVHSPVLQVIGSAAGNPSQITVRADHDAVVVPPSGAATITLSGQIGNLSVDLPRPAQSGSCTYNVAMMVEDAYQTQSQGATCACSQD